MIYYIVVENTAVMSGDIFHEDVHNFKTKETADKYYKEKSVNNVWHHYFEEPKQTEIKFEEDFE